MERRGFLKAVAALVPLNTYTMVDGMNQVDVDSDGAKYLIFVDRRAVDINDINPPDGSTVIPVVLDPGQTIDDCVRVYAVENYEEG